MNRLDFLTKVYSCLNAYPEIPTYAFTPLRRIVRTIADKSLPKYLNKINNVKGTCYPNLIVSFTSFPDRINEVWMVVKSLKNQSILPEKIILWLSNEQFPNEGTIPENLKKEVDDLFEIRMVDGDIRSHKKFYYVMQEYPEKSFVTCDDDIYYHPDMLKHLVNAHKENPECIVANITRRISYDSKKNLLPYKTWERNRLHNKNNLVQIGAGGVLYPPHLLHDLTLHQELFMKLMPMADDIWLNCMARLNGKHIEQTKFYYLPLPIASKAPSLSSVNRGENMNDKQIAQLREYLKDNSLLDVYDFDCSSRF